MTPRMLDDIILLHRPSTYSRGWSILNVEEPGSENSRPHSYS